MNKPETLSLKLRVLIESRIGLTNLCTQPLPAKTAFLLSKLLRVANGEYQSHDAALKTLCERFGTPGEKPGSFNLPIDKQPEFKKEMDELLDTEITLPGPVVLLQTLGDDVKLSALDLESLDWLVKET